MPGESGEGTVSGAPDGDLTERQRIESELEEAREAAARANKANTAFLSAASHELRQPVQALRLLNGALRRTVTDPLALEMIESQQESLDAMTDLLDSLLDIGRPEEATAEPFCKAEAPARSGFVVIVEDDPQIAKAWDRLLRSEGYRVAATATLSGLGTLLRDAGAVPDLVLSDYHLLDGCNGIQAVQAIREATGACMPALIVTGDPAKVMQEVEKLENSRLLSKPIGPEELLRLARTAIERGLSD